MSEPKISIIVGHNFRAKGAARALDGVPEWTWNRDLANRIRKLNPRNIEVFFRTPGRGGVAHAYAESDRWGADVSVELHFNAARARAATGCETLTSGSRGSRRLAAAVQKRMVAALGLRDRGIKTRTPGGKTALDRRGSTSLFAGRAPAVIVEPYFGSNINDCRIADAKKDVLAEAILAGALEAVR